MSDVLLFTDDPRWLRLISWLQSLPDEQFRRAMDMIVRRTGEV
jgi:hypothetical protein